MEKFVFMQKQMISTRELHAEHRLTGQNMQQPFLSQKNKQAAPWCRRKNDVIYQQWELPLDAHLMESLIFH